MPKNHDHLTKNLEITKEQFAYAKKGSLLIDTNNNTWTFLDEPIDKIGIEVHRYLRSPNNIVDTLIFVSISCKNMLTDFDLDEILELNFSNVYIKEI